MYKKSHSHYEVFEGNHLFYGSHKQLGPPGMWARYLQQDQHEKKFMDLYVFEYIVIFSIFCDYVQLHTKADFCFSNIAYKMTL